MTKGNSRAQGLGSLLSTPAPEAEQEPDYAAHRARQGGGKRTPADTPQDTAQDAQADAGRLPARTSRTTGALAQRGAPAVLPRKRTQRVPKDKLTCQVPVSVLDGLDALTERDDTRKYDEVEEALRAHLAAKGIELDED